MKKAITLLSLFLLVSGGISAQTKTRKTVKKTGEQLVTANKEVKYRFIVSFTSIGAGIDHKSVEKLDQFLKNQPKKPAFDKIQRGREGETEYCFLLKEFSTSEQKIFIEDVKKAIGSSDLVKYSEDQERVKK